MKTSKEVASISQSIIEIEKTIMWHELAVRHRGFSEYSGEMTPKELDAAKKKRQELVSEFYETRKNLHSNA
jgi:hypothetical protein